MCISFHVREQLIKSKNIQPRFENKRTYLMQQYKNQLTILTLNMCWRNHFFLNKNKK